MVFFSLIPDFSWLLEWLVTLHFVWYEINFSLWLSFLSWLLWLLSEKTVIILLQQFKHYHVESDWAMWILTIEQIAPQHFLTDWQMTSSNTVFPNRVRGRIWMSPYTLTAKTFAWMASNKNNFINIIQPAFWSYSIFTFAVVWSVS